MTLPLLDIADSTTVDTLVVQRVSFRDIGTTSKHMLYLHFFPVFQAKFS